MNTLYKLWGVNGTGIQVHLTKVQEKSALVQEYESVIRCTVYCAVLKSNIIVRLKFVKF